MQKSMMEKKDLTENLLELGNPELLCGESWSGTCQSGGRIPGGPFAPLTVSVEIANSSTLIYKQ